MENMSILNLFSLKQGLDLPKKAENNEQAGEFESLFKNYLDRSEKPVPKDTVKTEKTAKTEEPETPEEVIENLDIPQEDKDKLIKMLEEAETPKDMSDFLDRMIEMITQSMTENAETDFSAEDILEEIETALTEMAQTILASEEETTPKDSQLLEQALDRIVAVQAQQHVNAPQLTVVKNDTQVQQTAESSDAEADTQNSDSNRNASMDMAKNSSNQQLTSEMKEKIVELAGRQETAKAETGEHEFTIKTEQSEKIIKTEIKIESPRDIMKFAELMELAKSQKANKLSIQLHPQELGKVQIELTEQGGKVSGKVFFESDTARHLFTNNAESLRQQLAEKGVIVGSLEFFTKDFDQHQFSGWGDRDGRKSSDGLKAESLIAEDEEETEESDGIYA